jgi:AraC-like DNA-binding protein
MSQFLSYFLLLNVAIPAMLKVMDIPPIHGAIVTEVTLVDRIERAKPRTFQSESLPGHLIHVCTAGEVEQCAGGITQHFAAGDAIWYFENEPVQGRVLHAPWVFYTVNFRAPSLAPPPLSQRVQPVEPHVIQCIERLFTTWIATDMPAMLRQLRVHILLLELLADLVPVEWQHHRADDPTRLWWELERQLRSHLDQSIDLALLEELSGRSQRSINRACRLATGMPPTKRIKQVRLGYARGLVQLSELSMTEIALSTGYSRVQEFSRDYHANFGRTPSDDRRAGPDYRRRQTTEKQKRT